ncbi:MAG: FKBP-type peptidyl-prolyl cis-trans isomerase [Candidatus Heimdallarchaeota archaeon]
MAKVKNGDFIRITFTLKVKGTNHIIETSDEKIATKEGIYDEKNSYGPRLMIVGNEEMFHKRVNEAVIGKEVDEKFKVNIPPEETFGYKDTAKIRLLGRKELVAKNIIPEIGRQIQWGKQTGVIISVLGGRVRVDFNHPLVGQTVVYAVKITERISSIKKKLEAIIDFRLPTIDSNTFSVKDEKDKITITLPEEIGTKDPYIQYRKIQIANDINKSFPAKTEIIFIESFKFEAPASK